MTKKVFFIIGTLSNGGAERVVANLSRHLPKSIDKNIILYGNEAKVDYPFEGEIIYLDSKSPKSYFSKVFILLKRILQIRRLKRENLNATVISFTEYPNLLNMLAGKTHKSIVSVRSFMSEKHKKGLKSLFWNQTVRYLYKKARKIIAVSEHGKKDLIENYNLAEQEICVIYNSYPIHSIEKLAREEILKQECVIFRNPVVITSGRLIKSKGHIHLLNSFNDVVKQVPNAQLVILGEGYLQKDLENRVKELGIESQVHFLGFKLNPFKYIARSKVFIMTSYYEGFPNALAEAMACRVPVVSTDCPSGPREILVTNAMKECTSYDDREKHGILVPNITHQNEKEIENKITLNLVTLLMDQKVNSQYSEKSYRRIKKFSKERIIDEWEKIILN